jgi:uncharacterized membrane protein HdeD (DUF308 family)
MAKPGSERNEGQIGFGVFAILLGLILALTPLGQGVSDYGISGALNLPGWVLGLAVIPFGVAFVWVGFRGRGRRRKHKQ